MNLRNVPGEFFLGDVSVSVRIHFGKVLENFILADFTILVVIQAFERRWPSKMRSVRVNIAVMAVALVVALSTMMICHMVSVMMAASRELMRLVMATPMPSPMPGSSMTTMVTTHTLIIVAVMHRHPMSMAMVIGMMMACAQIAMTMMAPSHSMMPRVHMAMMSYVMFEAVMSVAPSCVETVMLQSMVFPRVLVMAERTAEWSMAEMACVMMNETARRLSKP